jgi:hypothetical protein
MTRTARHLRVPVPVPVLAFCLASVPCTALAAQSGQDITFFFNGTATGFSRGLRPSGLGVRAGSIAGSHVASVQLPPGATENTLSPALVAAAAQQQIVLEPQTAQGLVIAWRVTSVGGLAPNRGFLFGTDDPGLTGLHAQLASLTAASRAQGCAFAKAQTGATEAGGIGITLVGPPVGGGSIAKIGFTVPVFAGDSAAAVNERVRETLVAEGCTVFDVALPAFGGSGTLSGFGIDRFVDDGVQARVTLLHLEYFGGATGGTRAAGIGWFPTGGFAEYGRGHAAVAGGFEPYVRGEGGFAPGEVYDVVLEFGARTVGLLLVAGERAGTALPGGGTLLVDRATLAGVVPFRTDRSGTAAHRVEVPSDPAVIGQTLHYQAFGLGAAGASHTSGLYARVWQ